MASIIDVDPNRQFTKKGVTRTTQQGVSPIQGAGFNYSLANDKDMPTSAGLESILAELNQYLTLIDTAATDLIARGRADQANTLRTLGDRLKRTANTRGVSAEQIARQMSDVTSQANAQSGLFESKVMADKLARISGAIQQKTGIQQSIFRQDMQKADFREGVLQRMEKDPSVDAPVGSGVRTVRREKATSPVQSSVVAPANIRRGPVAPIDTSFLQKPVYGTRMLGYTPGYDRTPVAAWTAGSQNAPSPITVPNPNYVPPNQSDSSNSGDPPPGYGANGRTAKTPVGNSSATVSSVKPVNTAQTNWKTNGWTNKEWMMGLIPKKTKNQRPSVFINK